MSKFAKVESVVHKDGTVKPKPPAPEKPKKLPLPAKKAPKRSPSKKEEEKKKKAPAAEDPDSKADSHVPRANELLKLVSARYQNRG